MYQILKMAIFFYIFTWGIQTIHELGHYLLAKAFGFNAWINVQSSKYWLPKMYVHIEGNEISIFQDFLITVSGIVFEILFSILTFIILKDDNLRIIAICHVTTACLNLIPWQGNDGECLLKILSCKIGALKIKKILKYCFYSIPILVILAIFVEIAYKIVFSYQTYNINVIYQALFLLIIIITTLKYFIKNTRHFW